MLRFPRRKRDWIPVVRSWERTGARRGREATRWGPRWLAGDFTAQEVDELPGPGGRVHTARRQGVQADSSPRRHWGGGKDGIGTSRADGQRRENEDPEHG